MSDSRNESYVTKINLENVDQNRELISSNQTLKLFTFSKRSNPLDTELNYHEQQINESSVKHSRDFNNMPNSKNITPDEGGNPARGTVDDFLKMLSSRGSATTSKPPPPLPPKPKSGILSDRGFMRYFSSNKSSSPKSPPLTAAAANNDVVDGYNEFNNYNRKSSQILTDDNNSEQQLYDRQTRLGNMSSGNRKFTDLSEHYPSTTNSATISDVPTRLTSRLDYDGRGDDVAASFGRPIVTESPEETNNNVVVRPRERVSAKVNLNKSSVEILEIINTKPNISSLNASYGGGASNMPISNPTFNKSSKQQQQQQLFYENNSYADPIVTSATDDEADEDIVVVDVNGGEAKENDNYVSTMPTEIEVDTLINESAREEHQPPRTSTPNSSSISNSSATNKGVKNYCTANSRDNNNLDDDEDGLNISKDTDEFIHTPLNQSSGGGCELVGINDSDLKSSPNVSAKEIKMPYTVQVFDETANSQSRYTNVSQKQQQQQHQEEVDLHSSCNRRIEILEKQSEVFLRQIDGLQLQFEELKRKLTRLEVQVGEKSVRSNSGNLGAGISKSTMNISKTPPNSQATYSRTNIANISSRNSNNNGLLSTSLNTNNYNSSNRLTPSSHSYNNTVTKSLKKNNVHASTSSLYAESVNSSISPTSNYNQQHYKQSTSPTSMSARRDYPQSHTSMLSLNSLGLQSNSTLRKGTTISGSITNLSQIGSQLAQWPSIAEFVESKSRAKEITYHPDKRCIEMLLYNNLINMRLPSYVDEENYNLDRIVEPPNAKLKLNWVYGYRGRDCRSNIFYLPTGECVYFVASIVVLYNPVDKTQRHYLGHTDSVKCLAVHPNKLIIASGQSAVLNCRDKRPIVRVWNTISLATLRVIGFNEDFDRSICCLAFSKHDQGATLAVVDESTEHTITLLDWQREKNWRLAETNSGHDPVLAIDFHPIDKYSLVAVGRSTINFWDIRGMTMTKKAGLFDKYDKPKYVLCLTFNDMGDTITGDSNGNIIIWPRGANRPKKIIHDCHGGGIFSVLAMKDGTYLTGGRDRRVVEWDENFIRTGREAELPEHCGGVRYITYARGSQVLIGTLRNSILLGSLDNNFTLIMQGHAEATTALAVHPHQAQYLTGGFDDQIHLFDMNTHEVVWNKCLMMPATGASFSSNGNLLIIGSTLGKWLVIDAITQEILFTKCDGTGTISCIKFSPNGEYFAMGSSDMQTYIYQNTEGGSKFYRVGACVGHSAPVKEIDWSNDSRYIQTQSMNFELLFWKAENCRPLEEVNVIDDLKWFTHNCTIGFNTIGLWSDSSDSVLINSCDRSNDNQMIVSTTDTGSINVFKWPACYDQCLSQKYYGNVEKFDFIKFSHDDSKLIAIGAKSCVTTEWTVDKQSN